MAEKEINAPTVISTFAGGGGSSLGYSMAGFNELLAVEWDDNAVETFSSNFPNVAIYHGDIRNLTADNILYLAGIKKGELDVFDGSPPCQGFSTIGKRQLDDPRNYLFLEYVRLLQGLMPKVFVMENVSGMVKGKMKLIFVEILRELKKSGYNVSAKLMNAKYFSVPQSRERIIFIGTRKDIKAFPSHPIPESRIISVKEALVGLSDLESNARILKSDSKTYFAWASINPGRPMPNFNSRLKINPNIASPTQAKSRPHYHWKEPRELSPKEIARIGSFPDEFIFVGSADKINNRIGNSVPPLFMRAIAKHIRKQILDI